MTLSPNVSLGKWMLLGSGLVASPLQAALPPNGSFEEGQVKPWVVRAQEAEVEVSEAMAHEGKRALKISPQSAETKSFKADISQLIPWNKKQEFHPEAWIQGSGLEQSKLVITCYDENFSQMEEWVLQEVAASPEWQRLTASVESTVVIPEFTAHLQVKVSLQAKGSEPVYLDDLQVSKSAETEKKEAAPGFNSVLHQQVDLLKKAVKADAPKVLLLGDSSLLGWKRFASKLMNDLADDTCVLPWGFLGDASTEQVLKTLQQEEFRPVEKSTVVLSFGYYDILNGGLSGEKSAQQVLALAKWIQSVQPSVKLEYFALLDQHVDAPAEWLSAVAAFNQTLKNAGENPIELSPMETSDRSKTGYLQPNHLPNVEARGELTKKLFERLKPKAEKAKKE